MKKITALWLAAALALTFGFSTFASGIFGVGFGPDSGDRIFEDHAGEGMKEGFTLHIPIGLSAFLFEEDIADPAGITQDQLNGVGVTAGDDQELLDSLFYYKLWLDNAGSDNATVWLSFTAGHVDVFTEFDFAIGLYNRQNPAEETDYSQRGRIYGSIEPDEPASNEEPEDGSEETHINPPAKLPEGITAGETESPSTSVADQLIGFNPTYTMRAIDPVEAQPGQTLLLPVPAEIFQFSEGSNAALTPQKADQIGLTAVSTDSEIEAVIVQDNGEVKVQLSVSPSAALTLHTFSVDLIATGAPFNGSSIVFQDLSVDVTAAQEDVSALSQESQMRTYTATPFQTTQTRATEILNGLKEATPSSESIALSRGGSGGYVFPIPLKFFDISNPADRAHDYFPSSLFPSSMSIELEGSTANQFNITLESKTSVTTATGTVYADIAGVKVFPKANSVAGKHEVKIYLRYGGKRVHYLTLNITVTDNVITTSKITGIRSDAQLGYTTATGIFGALQLNGTQIPSADGLDIVCGDQLTVNFDSSFFEWDVAPSTTAYLTKSNIKAGKVDVRILKSKNSDVVDSAEIRYDNGNAYLQVFFVEDFVSTKSKDFEVDVVLTVNKKYIKDTALTISGTIENEIVDVYEDDDYVDLSGGQVADAQDSVKNIDIEIGDGVTVHARMSKGKLYYGVATMDLSSSDEDTIDKYPEIEYVITLNTIGLNSSSNTVSLDYGSKLHVYNSNMEYLGTTDEKLPYSTKYYLSTRELTVDGSSGDGSGSGGSTQLPVDSAPLPENPTDSVQPPSNPNLNPNTGR